jgi:hypothetical protein
MVGATILLMIVIGCSDSGPQDRIGGKAKDGTPIGHWMASGPKPVEVVFHDTGEITWMEDSEESGSWEQTGPGAVKISRQQGTTDATFSIAGDTLTLQMEGREPLTLQKQ